MASLWAAFWAEVEALYCIYITVACAQLERGILRGRVKAGMDRARREVRHVGRPRVTRARARLGARLAKLLGISLSTARSATTCGGPLWPS